MNDNAMPEHNLDNAESVYHFMSMSTSLEDFNARIDVVKAANNNQYPSFWYETIILSKLADQLAVKWGFDDSQGNATDIVII